MSSRARRRTTIRAVSGIGVAVLALAGCSGSDEPPAESSSSSAATDDATESTGAPSSEQGQSGGEFDKAAAQEVLLTADEIGSGYTAIPDAQLSAALAQATGPLADAMASMQVEPAVCEAIIKASVGQMTDMAAVLDQTAMAMFTAGTDMAAETIAPASLLSAGDPAAQADACSEMTLTIMGVTAKASMTPVDIDLGDKSTAFITEITMNAGGQTVNQTTAQATIIEGENALNISLTGAKANEADLTEVTTKAYEKAEPVLG